MGREPAVGSLVATVARRARAGLRPFVDVAMSAVWAATWALPHRRRVPVEFATCVTVGASAGWPVAIAAWPREEGHLDVAVLAAWAVIEGLPH